MKLTLGLRRRRRSDAIHSVVEPAAGSAVDTLAVPLRGGDGGRKPVVRYEVEVWFDWRGGGSVDEDKAALENSDGEAVGGSDVTTPSYLSPGACSARALVAALPQRHRRWRVKLRYSQLRALHLELRQAAPWMDNATASSSSSSVAYSVSHSFPLKRANFLGSNFERRFIDARRSALDAWLQSALSLEILAGSAEMRSALVPPAVEAAVALTVGDCVFHGASRSRRRRGGRRCNSSRRRTQACTSCSCGWISSTVCRHASACSCTGGYGTARRVRTCGCHGAMCCSRHCLKRHWTRCGRW